MFEIIFLSFLIILIILYIQGRKPSGPDRTKLLQKPIIQHTSKNEKIRSYRRVIKNFTIYGNSNTFTIHPIHINNLVSIELLSGNFPRGQYLVDACNCWLDISIHNEIISINLPLGSNYTAETIAIALNALTANKILFEYDSNTSRYKLTSVSNFVLLFKTGPHSNASICRELGFGNDFDVDSQEIDGNFTLQSDKRSDLTGARFIHILCHDMDEKLDRGVLAQVPLFPPSAYASYNPGTISCRYFDPCPLRSLTISISEYDTCKRLVRPYEFNGLYWGMVLQATVLEPNINVDMNDSPASTLVNQVYWVHSKKHGAAKIICK